MKSFMDSDFLLRSESAKRLYHDYAEKMPIIDYHCHLKPQEIAEDKRYRSITEIWLGGDHYKWRAMRGCGIEEKYITGNASDYDKFLAWARAMPSCIGNPLYHWTHLELQRYFDIYEPLSEKNASDIWNRCNELLESPDFSARGLIKRSRVKALCTTDDPCDDLMFHSAIAADKTFDVGVYPAFRPDRAVNIKNPEFIDYIMYLGRIANVKIKTVDDIKTALSERISYFIAHGCRISDHGLDYVPYVNDETSAQFAFEKAKKGEKMTSYEEDAYKTAILLHCGREYARRGIVMQIHFSALRNTSDRMFAICGADAGFDAIRDCVSAQPLSKLLNALDCDDLLPKTVLYSLNPCHNEMLIALATCFNSGGIRGKIQLGSGWWFNDQKDGMIRQLNALSHIGLLAPFVGMLTDSRSFLSYTRHEYFRRILCDYLAAWMEDGEIPADYDLVGKIVEDISYNNANTYFGFNIE